AIERPSYYDSAGVHRAYEMGRLHVHQPIRFRLPSGEFVNTTTGRVLFNDIVPEAFGFYNEQMDKKRLRELVSRAHRELPEEETVLLVDAIKDIGFKYAT